MIIGLLAVNPFHAQSTSARQHEQTIRYSPAPAAFLQVQPTSNPEQDSTKSRQPQTLLDRLVDAVVAQWPIVAIGIATLFIIGWQAREMRRATEAMLVSVEAVKRQTNVLVNSERAWVEGSIVPKLQIGVLRWGLEIRNDGKTPARLVSCRLNYDRVDPNGTWSMETLKGSQHRRLELFLGTEKSLEIHEFDIKRLFSDLTDHENVLTGIIFLTVHYNNVVGADKDRECTTIHGYKYDILTGNLERIPIFTNYT